MEAKKIYDCFIFYNELELLRIRFDELYDVVDHFLICEATVTFQGKAKPLFFEENKEEFKQFADKIIHVVVEDMPSDFPQAKSSASIPVGSAGENNFWSREHHQRNAIRRGLRGAAPQDIICISDCDEIITRDAIRILRERDGYFLLDMPMYQFFLNMRAQAEGWRKVFAYSYELDAEVGDFNVIRTHEVRSFERFAGRNHRIKRAGWHFTFLGGAQQVRDKLDAYSHASGWQRELRKDEVLLDQMLALREVGGTKGLRFQTIDETYPLRVRRDHNRYIDIGLAKDPLTRLIELEKLWSEADKRLRACSQLYERSLQILDDGRQAMAGVHLRVATLVNLIPSSQKFRLGWNGGMQSARAHLSDAVTGPMVGGVPMQHVRDPAALTQDSNVGYFNLLPVVPGRAYVASCFVWIPEHFAGQRVDLCLDDWAGQTKSILAIDIVECWQRIKCVGLAPLNAMGCNVILRVQSVEHCVLYSAAWQLEEGSSPTDYLATDA